MVSFPDANLTVTVLVLVTAAKVVITSLPLPKITLEVAAFTLSIVMSLGELVALIFSKPRTTILATEASVT